MRALVAGRSLPGVRAQNPGTDTSGKKPTNYAYRYRFLGVYDSATGDPVEGAEVIDALSVLRRSPRNRHREPDVPPARGREPRTNP
jgi:hypothetical protein